MKHILLTILAVLTTALPALAQAFEINGIHFLILSEEDMICEVTRGTYSGDIIIPSTASINEKTFRVVAIGDWAMYDCPDLTSVIIPNSVTNIGYAAFHSSSNLKSVQMGNATTKIGNHAFAKCASLTSIEIPNTVISIGEWAFSYCSSLASIDIPNSVTTIELGAFYECTGLKSVKIPDSVTKIGNQTFYNCSSLTSVVIPNSLTEIEYFMFYGCTSLESVKIGNSVTEIDSRVFYNCSSLTSVVLPSSLTEIKGEVFYDCTSLKEITSLAVTPPNCYGSTFDGIAKKEISIKVPEESVEAYKAADYWKEFWNITAIETDAINTPRATAFIRTHDGAITISGTTQGEKVQLYTNAGLLLASVTADGEQTTIPCPVTKGEIVIVKYGNQSVKIVM